ncbi:MAG: hybrid sensor histidine kinase/response regulator [Chloroflexota bacterium]
MQQYQADILIVDDVPQNVKLLINLLREKGYKARPTTSGAMALRAARASKPDLILLDISMPNMDGYEVCTELKADPDLHDVPVIFVSALNEVMDKVRAFRVGGADYVTKPFEFAEVLARIETHLTLAHQRKEIETRRNRELAYTKRMAETRERLTEQIVERSVSADVDDYLQNIRQNSGRIVDLVNNILDTTYVESGAKLNFQPVNLVDLVQHRVDELQTDAHNWQTNLPDDEVMVDGDSDRLGQLVSNLLDNAVKFTPQGGHIAVSLMTEQGNALLIVADTGSGISAADVPAIFEKFYRADAHVHIPGSGLGLSVVQAIAEQHNGTITVESESGSGSTFTVQMPLMPAE